MYIMCDQILTIYITGKSDSYIKWFLPDVVGNLDIILLIVITYLCQHYLSCKLKNNCVSGLEKVMIGEGFLLQVRSNFIPPYA